jgi:hypothetical protein
MALVQGSSVAPCPKLFPDLPSSTSRGWSFPKTFSSVFSIFGFLRYSQLCRQKIIEKRGITTLFDALNSLNRSKPHTALFRVLMNLFFNLVAHVETSHFVYEVR